MIELLTVIVIIGMLAAIAVPAFFLHRDRARDASAQAAVRAAQTAAQQIGEENDGNFSGLTVEGLERAEPSLRDVDMTVPTALRDTFTVRVQSETGNTFDVTQNRDGTVDLKCANADDAGCPSDGSWD